MGSDTTYEEGIIIMVTLFRKAMAGNIVQSNEDSFPENEWFQPDTIPAPPYWLDQLEAELEEVDLASVLE